MVKVLYAVKHDCHTERFVFRVLPKNIGHQGFWLSFFCNGELFGSYQHPSGPAPLPCKGLVPLPLKALLHTCNSDRLVWVKEGRHHNRSMKKRNELIHLVVVTRHGPLYPLCPLLRWHMLWLLLRKNYFAVILDKLQRRYNLRV